MHNLHSASFDAGHAVAPVKERKGGMEEGIMGRKKKGKKEGKEGGREGKGKRRKFVFTVESKQKYQKNNEILKISIWHPPQ